MFLGQPIEEIKIKSKNNSLWVFSGKHVSPMYLGNETANRNNKEKDSDGITWHNMGDRINLDEEGYGTLVVVVKIQNHSR